MLKEIVRKYKCNKKKGFSTIIALVLLAIFLPLMLFLVVDIPYYMEANRKVKSIADNVSASAATILKPQSLADGIVEIDEDKAETYILEDLVVWFNLQDIIYKTDVPGVRAILKKDDTLSFFDTDPLVIRIKPDMKPITADNVLKATKIEYFIHATNGRETYRFLSGQKVTVSTPTIAVKITTKTNGLMFNIPISLVKIGMTEAVFDPQTK